MMYYTLAIAPVFLVASHFAARRAPHNVRWSPFFGISVVLLLLPCVAVNPAAFILFGSLCMSLYFWPNVRSRMRTFLPLSIGSTLVTACFVGYSVRDYDRTLKEIREQYPFVSMEDRVPEPVPSNLAEESMDSRLVSFENQIELEQGLGRFRSNNLKRLHDDTVHRFATAPGFGVGRLIAGPELLRNKRQILEPPSQSPLLVSEKLNPLSATYEHEMMQVHTEKRVEFANVNAWGLIRSRREVSGFLSHGFSWPRTSESAWEVRRVDLISLLLNKEPVVYVSEKFPEMEKLRTTSTRALDSFEKNALDSIRAGSEIVGGESDKSIRLVGAIRSARQCVECHGGKRGDLLGAFSYTLRRVEAKKQ